MPNRDRRARRAFTLVELLVVIGIIGLLVGILLPALSRARDAANSAKCLSNMRQAAVAITFYVNETKGKWIPGYYIPEETISYASPTGAPNYNGSPFYYVWLSGHYFKGDPKLWHCPSDYQNANDPIAKNLRLYSKQQDCFSSYFVNSSMPKWHTTPLFTDPLYAYARYFNPFPLKYIRSKTRMMVYGESNRATMLAWNSASPAAFTRWDHRRNTSMSVCFADGHAEQISKSELLPRAGETTSPLPARVREYWFGSPTYPQAYNVDVPATWPQ